MINQKVESQDSKPRFGGKRYSCTWQAKGAAHYGLTNDELLEAWHLYQLGRFPRLIVQRFNRGLSRKPRTVGDAARLSFRKLIVEWGALGLPVWEFGRRSKIRQGTQQLLDELSKRFDLPVGATMYAALRFAETHGADLRAILDDEFGAAPKRPKRWYQKDRNWKNIAAGAKPLGMTRPA